MSQIAIFCWTATPSAAFGAGVERAPESRRRADAGSGSKRRRAGGEAFGNAGKGVGEQAPSEL